MSAEDQKENLKSIRLLIVDDRPRSREGLRALLETNANIRVVAEATNGQEAIQLVDEHHPDLVLMDAHMPVMDGIEALRQIKAHDPHVHVIVLTMYPAYRAHAMEAGAQAFLVKGCPSEELLEMIQKWGERESQKSPPAAEQVSASLEQSA